MFCGNFAPSGWATRSGQLLPISQNTALFSLLGTTYGGPGRGQLRAAQPPGDEPHGTRRLRAGLARSVLGQTGGAATVTLATGRFLSTIPAANLGVAMLAPPGRRPGARGPKVGRELSTSLTSAPTAMSDGWVGVTRRGPATQTTCPPALSSTSSSPFKVFYPSRSLKLEKD